MKKYILGFITGLLVAIIPGVFALSPLYYPGFSDVDDDSDWFADEIEYLWSKGVIDGYGDGTFRPDNNVTRAESAAMLYKSFGVLPSRGDVAQLERRVEAINAKLGTLNFPGICYDDGVWYDEGDVTYSSSSETCSCLSDGTVFCNLSY